ncbi:M15 family metallopeptidase [Gloeobacter kilaueensis]|uniref:D-alanyl-D-alanine dipeptidase n=1 Tax=Gloeobacter kilaueensis (strain ATCC BAA-2537 / CCAP 1431/1 / ULC 316 / JS1) TaxID=1183438 RepID=U5QJA4_GLOK1|nr:M15 family metallopeptidase [Gloeobacter kilaueensis]AGY57755.1 D-alanyl-D-alanine dipeptidase [Gloeobacter kilaueensis JS1]
MSPGPQSYQQVPIVECGEALVELPVEFARQTPHPYAVLGAPYGQGTPFALRTGVVQKLIAAQNFLQARHPELRLLIFDAYRPVAVQQFMVDWTFADLVARANQQPEELSVEQKQAFYQQVYQFWARPSLDPATPPPHSTGAAVDLTLLTEAGTPVAMGGDIDEIAPHSYPDHYAAADLPAERQFHHLRTLLRSAMTAAGFSQHPREWWHFSCGDQMWAFHSGQPVAHYGGLVDF